MLTVAVLGGEAIFCAVMWWLARRVVTAFGSYAAEDRKVGDLILRFVSEAEYLRREMHQVREAVEVALAEREPKSNGERGVA